MQHHMMWKYTDVYNEQLGILKDKSDKIYSIIDEGIEINSRVHSSISLVFDSLGCLKVRTSSLSS